MVHRQLSDAFNGVSRLVSDVLGAAANDAASIADLIERLLRRLLSSI